jgi:hypothetical protein
MLAKLWFKCAAVFDPVTPKLVEPCKITWEAKYRDINLIIERPLKGDELVKRMKGWVTVNPSDVINIVNKYGKFVLNECGELFVELPDLDSFNNLKNELENNFQEEIILETLN